MTPRRPYTHRRPTYPAPHGTPRGFTLVEVLVALAIVSITLLAGHQALNALILNSSRQNDMLLAQICTENQLIALRLAEGTPSAGDSQVPCTQAGREFSVHLTVMPTPNINFQRVDAQTFDGDTPLLRISTIIGGY